MIGTRWGPVIRSFGGRCHEAEGLPVKIELPKPVEHMCAFCGTWFEFNDYAKKHVVFVHSGNPVTDILLVKVLA